MNRGASKQQAYNIMKRLAIRNNEQLKVPAWFRYLTAVVLEIILLTYNVPSKEEIQIKLIETIIPLSEATKPMEGIVSLFAAILQIISLILILDLLQKLFNALKKKCAVILNK